MAAALHAGISLAAWVTRMGRCTWRRHTQRQPLLWQAQWQTLGTMEHERKPGSTKDLHRAYCEGRALEVMLAHLKPPDEWALRTSEIKLQCSEGIELQ